MDMHQEVKAGDRDGQQQRPSRRVWEESGQDRRSGRRATRPPLEIKGDAATAGPACRRGGLARKPRAPPRCAHSKGADSRLAGPSLPEIGETRRAAGCLSCVSELFPDQQPGW